MRTGRALAGVWAFDPTTEDFVAALPLQQARGEAVGGMLNGRATIGLGIGGRRGDIEPLASLEALLPCPACGPALAIAKTGPTTALVGAPFTYTLTVTNSGSAPAANLLVTDTLPTGVTYVRGGTLVGDEVHFPLASLAAGAQETVKFVVAANNGGVVVNNAYAVTADGGVRGDGVQA